jgi:hypothetical protein
MIPEKICRFPSREWKGIVLKAGQNNQMVLDYFEGKTKYLFKITGMATSTHYQLIETRLFTAAAK